MPSLQLHPDRLFPSDERQRAVARELYAGVADLPLVCPHGHVDPALFALDEPFGDPAQLLIIPDHYVTRMLYSQGIALESLGVPTLDGEPYERDPRRVWRLLAEHWHLFRGTPSRLWLEHELHELFGVREVPSADNADRLYEEIAACLQTPAFRPRALYERFNIEVLATTDTALDDLEHHRAIAASGWSGRIIPTFRPDALVDMDSASWRQDVARLGELTGTDTERYDGYISALEQRREVFIQHGATASDHGHPTAATLELDPSEAAALFERGLRGRPEPGDAERFRAHMVMEFARMSVEDGLVLQLHSGSQRGHNAHIDRRFGPDQGADIPAPTDYVRGLKPLLNRFGNDPRLRIIVFTLDETTHSRELAPLAGHYPALLLGPPWWFFDSPEGMRRFRENVTETAGFYNTAGFNDDTRAFPSVPARHDVARRLDCAFLARLVAEHRLPLDEAHETARALAYELPKKAYRL